MSRQWLRKVRVIFSGGGLIVNAGAETDKQLKVEFAIEKSISGTTNTLDVRIHNLAESTRNAIDKEFSDIEIQAGYIPPGGSDLTGSVFFGQIEDWTHEREGTEIVTTVRAGDGGKAVRKSTLSKTYPAGTPPEAVVEDVYAEYSAHGVKRGEWLFPPMEPFIRPYSVSGAGSRILNDLGRSKGFYWSIQNQVMEVIPGDESLPLITLINPEVRPNRIIAVESEFVPAANGEFRVGRIDYSGSNRDGDFHMIIHGERVFGGKVDEGMK